MAESPSPQCAGVSSPGLSAPIALGGSHSRTLHSDSPEYPTRRAGPCVGLEPVGRYNDCRTTTLCFSANSRRLLGWRLTTRQPLGRSRTTNGRRGAPADPIGFAGGSQRLGAPREPTDPALQLTRTTQIPVAAIRRTPQTATDLKPKGLTPSWAAPPPERAFMSPLRAAR